MARLGSRGELQYVAANHGMAGRVKAVEVIIIPSHRVKCGNIGDYVGVV